MAQNDWYFNYSYRSGDSQGVAIFHDSLSNPLTNEEHGVGQYCRRFSYYNPNYSGDPGFSLHTKNSNFINVPDTKAISVRAWLRVDQHGGRTGYHGITVKSTSTSWAPSGYFFRIQNNNTAYLDGTVVGRPSNVVFEHNWHHMRLDVIPIKHNGVVIMDHLKAYFENVDGEWQLVGEKYIESTDSNFISWSGNRYNGVRTWYDQSYEGGTHHFYVDKVEMYLETVEQPEKLVLSLTNDTGPSNQDFVTSDASVTVSDAELGATRYYSLDNTNWSTSLPTFSSGSNILYAKQVSAEGRTSPTETLQFTYIPDDTHLSMDSATSASAVENSGESQVVYTAQASNPYSSIFYSLKEVDDYLKFSINSSTGEVTLHENPNFELSSSYDFTFQALDLAGFEKEQAVQLSISDQNEAPSFQVSFSVGTQENLLSETAIVDSVVATLSATDPENDSVTFSLVSQDEAGTFAVSGSSLVLTGTLDYETRDSHSITLRASDGQLDVDQSYTVYIGDANEAPTFSLTLVTGSNTNPILESATQGTVLGTLSGSDADGDSLTFSIVSQSPADVFEISGSDLKLSGALDHEANATHSLTIRVSDGANNVDQSHTIYVGNVNEAPTFSLSLVSGSQETPLLEDSSAGFVLGTLSATDPEGDSVEFSIASQSPADVFEISGSDLKLSGALDYETNTTHSITLRATDGVNTVDQSHTIYISDVEETAADPDFSDVSLLLKMDGSNGSTTFADDSSGSLTVTANGNAALSTTESKFGGASGYFDGTGDYLQLPYDSSLDLGSGSVDWTVECWVRMPSIPSDAMDIMGASLGGGPQAKWMITMNMGTDFLHSANRVGFTTRSGGADQWINASHTWQVDTWYHIAVVHSSGTTTMYVDGTSVGSIAYNVPAVNSGLRVGSDGEGYKYFAGYMDDVRITKGTARYTSDFTPPDSHPTS